MPVPMLVAQAVDERDSAVDAPARPAPGTAATPAPSGLALQLKSRALADLRDDELVDVIAGWEQVLSAATARQVEAITELAAKCGAREHRYVADEVACALACTRRSAQTKVDLADGLAAFPELHDGLTHGAIDVHKSRVVLDEVAGAAPYSSREAVREAVATAAHLTAPQLARRVRRIVLAADPAAAARRCERAHVRTAM